MLIGQEFQLSGRKMAFVGGDDRRNCGTLKRSAAEPQPKGGTAILAVSVTGGTPVPQFRGQIWPNWPYIMRKMFAKKTRIYVIAMQSCALPRPAQTGPLRVAKPRWRASRAHRKLRLC